MDGRMCTIGRDAATEGFADSQADWKNHSMRDKVIHKQQGETDSQYFRAQNTTKG